MINTCRENTALDPPEFNVSQSRNAVSTLTLVPYITDIRNMFYPPESSMLSDIKDPSGRNWVLIPNQMNVTCTVCDMINLFPPSCVPIDSQTIALQPLFRE